MGLFNDFVALYVQGGIRILSSGRDDDSSEVENALIETVIQPDADIIIRISPDIFGHPDTDICREHFAKVREKITSIRRFRLFVKNFWMVLAVLIFTLNLEVIDIEALARSAIFSGVLSIIAILLSWLVKTIVIFLLRQTLERNLANFFT